MTHHILVTGKLHESAMAALQNNPGYEVTYQPDTTRENLLKLVQTAHVLVTRSETDVDKEVIDHAKELKIVARAAVGVGNIDIGYATEKGILVLNCPGKNTNSAAELTMGLLLTAARCIGDANSTMKNGGWDRHRFDGTELRGKSIGIVGLGNVGHRVAKFASGFDMTVLAYDPYIAPQVFQRNNAVRVESLEELADQVDILTVHVPLNKETTGMVDSKILARLKAGAFVVNAARGGVIDEEALVAALNENKLAGVGIDTWVGEPAPIRALVEHDKVICTPHIGATTKEAQIAIGQAVVEQIEKALEGGVVDHPVNLPNIGTIDDPAIKSFAVLAEKLGSMCGQLIEFNPESVEIAYRGDLANLDHSIVRLGFMKGYAGQVVDGYVSFVNAESHFEKMGLQVTDRSDPAFDSYKSALKVWVRGAGGKVLTLGGVVFDGRYPRISLINDFYFEVEPDGHMIVLENEDRPGVIGDVGHYLAKAGINIDTFALSRNSKGGRAMALIRIDSSLENNQVDEMKKIANVVTVHGVNL